MGKGASSSSSSSMTRVWDFRFRVERGRVATDWPAITVKALWVGGWFEGLGDVGEGGVNPTPYNTQHPRTQIMSREP